MAKKGYKRAVSGDNEEPRETGIGNMDMLDQAEIMKTMMAARKGKGREESPSDDDDDLNDSSSGSEEEDEDDNVNEEHSDGDDTSSEASTSTSQLRGTKRSRSPSSSPVRQPAPARVAETTSRVKLASKAAADSGKSSNNPFDTPKAAAHSTFASLGLSQPLINALAGINIQKPTEIQSACVGPIMNGWYLKLALTSY